METLEASCCCLVDKDLEMWKVDVSRMENSPFWAVPTTQWENYQSMSRDNNNPFLKVPVNDKV